MSLQVAILQSTSDRQAQERTMTDKKPRGRPKTTNETVLDWEVTDLFYKNKDATTPIVINRGGAGSSKSHSLAQLFLYKFLTEQRKKFLIVRKTLPALKLSTLMLFNSLLSDLGIMGQIEIEKVMLNYRFKNNFLHFGSLDDPEKAKSTEWNYIWLEEATEFTQEDFRILKLRLRAKPTDGNINQIFMSFNPVDENHWIKKMIDNSGGSHDITEIHSAYRDNPFLFDEYRQGLETLVREDINFYNVYTLGQWGRLSNIIYSNWNVVPEMPTGGDTIYGLDFGFNNPTALIQVTIKDAIVYVKELIYQSKLTNHDLIHKMQQLLPLDHKRYPIYADVAEPDRIQEIYNAGFNILPSDKNVKDGIDFVKRQALNLHIDSINVRKEIVGYSYKKDRLENVLDEPVKYNDHAMDAIRYALYTHLGKRAAFDPKQVTFGTKKRITVQLNGF
ncbi:Phage terminase, large subunit, PBSX [Candidatus Magnetobacterium bavaricum]|uniref:Phage terminase, large subunit, PBSX n=1 Tax=Candidatus Magnetobacterium bavaricum TaxID=29290 RepID=A0A0F3GLZ1_9BACT|nr:Phage terminase, large subunit, PBSX [Candidatus Magnetobacterium bavaricum]